MVSKQGWVIIAGKLHFAARYCTLFFQVPLDFMEFVDVVVRAQEMQQTTSFTGHTDPSNILLALLITANTHSSAAGTHFQLIFSEVLFVSCTPLLEYALIQVVTRFTTKKHSNIRKPMISCIISIRRYRLLLVIASFSS